MYVFFKIIIKDVIEHILDVAGIPVVLPFTTIYLLLAIFRLGFCLNKSIAAKNCTSKFRHVVQNTATNKSRLKDFTISQFKRIIRIIYNIFQAKLIKI